MYLLHLIVRLRNRNNAFNLAHMCIILHKISADCYLARVRSGSVLLCPFCYRHNNITPNLHAPAAPALMLQLLLSPNATSITIFMHVVVAAKGENYEIDGVCNEFVSFV